MVGICPRCNKEVSTIRKIEWKWFATSLVIGVLIIVIAGLSLASLLLGIIPALIYVFFHFTKAPKTCPICEYRNIFDEGKELNKEVISNLETRMLHLDQALKNKKKISEQEREKLTNEIQEIAEELRKYGYEGSVNERIFLRRKKRNY